MVEAPRPAALVALVGAALASAQHGLFGAMEMPGDGLSPRLYANAPQLAKRDGSPCSPGYHRCVDIGQDGQCCPNDQYCYINRAGDPKCCAIGSNCNSGCGATDYQCVVTVTVSGAASAAISGPAATSTSTSTACCGRSCKSTSMFRCEAQYGGNCCGYGSTCASGGICRSTRSSVTAVVTAQDARCSSPDQFACPDSDGCCYSWMHCTTATGGNVCAPGNTANGYLPDATGPSDGGGGGGGGGGLSTGAKAGIGAGIALVALAVLGAVSWLCLLRRRRRRQPSETSSSSGPRPQGGPVVSDRSPAAMSEVTSDVTHASRLRGLAQDYFGPSAVAGPYTDTGPAASPATSPGLSGRGVPVQAHSPSDITAPVEIDSRVSRGLGKDDDVVVTSRHVPPPARENTDGRFELDGLGVVAQLDSVPSPAADSPTYQEPGPGGRPPHLSF